MSAALCFDEMSMVYKSRRLWRKTSFRALDGLNLEVETGEVFGFLGPNGAGKSTALHLLMGFILPDRGRGTVLGHAFGDARAHRRIGFLPENLTFYRFLTAEKLLRYFGRLNDVSDGELAVRIPALLEQVKLTEHGRRRVGGYSRGMLQRLGLAAVLVHNPDLLVLDEPTSGLDPLGRRLVRDILLDLKGQGKTIFLSSHLLSEIEMVCDRVAILHKGKLQKSVSMNQLLEASEKVELSVRNAPAVWLDTVRQQGAELHEQGGLQRVVCPRSDQRAVVERLWKEGGELVSLIPSRTTVEDLFLEVVEGSRDSEGVG